MLLSSDLPIVARIISKLHIEHYKGLRYVMLLDRPFILGYVEQYQNGHYKELRLTPCISLEDEYLKLKAAARLKTPNGAHD